VSPGKSSLARGFALPRPPVRKTPRDNAAAERFLAGKSAPGDSRLRRPESGERVNVYLPPELAQELRVYCAGERRSVSDAMTEAVRDWLRRNKR
jgi:CopG-like RHH_1 or ribbon-helix-helix domain, RHH_5